MYACYMYLFIFFMKVTCTYCSWLTHNFLSLIFFLESWLIHRVLRDRRYFNACLYGTRTDQTNLTIQVIRILF